MRRSDAKIFRAFFARAHLRVVAHSRERFAIEAMREAEPLDHTIRAHRRRAANESAATLNECVEARGGRVEMIETGAIHASEHLA